MRSSCCATPSTVAPTARCRRRRRRPSRRRSPRWCLGSSSCEKDPEAIDAAVGPRTAAVLLEPIQGESGVLPLVRRAPAGRPRRLRSRGRGADLRRDPDRHGPHRHALGLRADRRRARRADQRQGARRRAADRRAGDRREARRHASSPGITARPSPAARWHARRRSSALEICSEPEPARARVAMGERFAAALEELPFVASVRGRGLLLGAELIVRGLGDRARAPGAARTATRDQRDRAVEPADGAAADRHRSTDRRGGGAPGTAGAVSDREGLLSSSSPFDCRSLGAGARLHGEQEARTGEPVVRDDARQARLPGRRSRSPPAPAGGSTLAAAKRLRQRARADRMAACCGRLHARRGLDERRRADGADRALRRRGRARAAAPAARSRMRTCRRRWPAPTPSILHDFRVAIRRTRSVLREMRGVFAPAGPGARARLVQVASEIRPARPATSTSTWRSSSSCGRWRPPRCRPTSQPLRAAAAASGTGGRARRWRRRSGASGARGLCRRSGGRSSRCSCSRARPNARMRARPIGELAAERIRKVHRRMVKMGRAITPDSPPEQYHELRKKGKELRYLLELFATPLFDRRGRQADDQERSRACRTCSACIRTVRCRSRCSRSSPTSSSRKARRRRRADGDRDADRAARGRRASGPRTLRRGFAEFASEAQCKLVARAFS